MKTEKHALLVSLTRVHSMTRAELVRLARDLYSTHGLLPVPVAGKVPLGGTGWNLLSIEARLAIAGSESCTGLGIQCGLVFHPVLGPKEARAIDTDIDDHAKSMLFASTLQTFFQPTHWRWGRRPATLVFTEPGKIKREKFGPVQLLGQGKQIVYWGDYRNKTPLSTDPPQYWHEGRSIFDLQPPDISAATLTQALEASVTAAGFSFAPESKRIEATPLTAADLAMLTPESMLSFRTEMQNLLDDVDRSPVGSGRGTKLFNLGLKYGALIKASGHAPLLADAGRQVCPAFIEYDVIEKHALLEQIGRMAEDAFACLRGTLGQGDRRDFARGVGASMGLSQNVAVMKAKQPLPMPSAHGHAAQTLEALLLENIQPQKFLVNRFFPESGCIVLAGKPKIGKGWIVLELGLSVAEGGRFWGEQCEQGEVLMYMLEDGKRRITERVKMLRPLGSAAVKNLRFRYSGNGPFYVHSDGTGSLLDDVREQKRLFPGIRLIVIDVLQRIRGTTERNDNAYEKDYRIMGAIQKLSVEFNVLILVVHHTKKGKVDDAIDSISGSFGVSGATDGSIIIGKEGDVVKVESRMRDIFEFEFEMIKEGNSPMWHPAQTVAELMEPSGTTKAYLVLKILREAACVLTPGDIALRTGIKENSVAMYLVRLLKNEQVMRPSRGFYMAANLPHRERISGVIELLKYCPKYPVTEEIKAQYAPNGAPPGASYMILTPVAIKEIEAGFVNGKDCLQSLKLRGLAVYNSDTVWLIGNDWEPVPAKLQPNPFGLKMPWE